MSSDLEASRSAPTCNILLTGAASGVGRELAVLLAAEGHRLFLLDREEHGLQQTISHLPSPNACINSGVVDITSAEQIAAFLARNAEHRIDVLINNAGLQHVSPIEEFPEAAWDLLLDVMLKGPFLLSKAVLPRMRRDGFGRIINIGSIHSLVASPFKGAYVAAKHGLLGLGKVIGLETGAVDVTVNTICTAYIRTPLVDSQIRAQAETHGISEQDVIEKIMLEPMPKKVFITVEEVAAAVAFLMSRAARNITGQTIVIDGGWTTR